MAGLVLLNDQRIDKPGTSIKQDSPLRIKTKSKPFASRAGMKLEGAFKAYDLDVSGKIALDLGASTGGFTDCMLKRGAEKVYAVDVGTNQLVYQLRIHPKVVSLEKTHARKLSRDNIPQAIEFLTVDVSFTSLTYVLPPVLPLLAPTATGILLFKPQFEAPREKVGVGGIVEDAVASEAAETMEKWFAENQIQVLGKMKSPVKGRDGNQEYLYWVELHGPAL